jgi:hypothetical protein
MVNNGSLIVNTFFSAHALRWPTTTLAAVVAIMAWSPAVRAQDVTITQTNPGTAVFWEPVIADFCLVGPQSRVQTDAISKPPSIDDELINPAPAFTVFLPPADGPADLSYDWQQITQKNAAGEPFSAWLTASDQGRDRIFAHKVFDEGKLVGYAERARYLVRLRVVIARERLPIPNDPSGAQREEALLKGIKVTSGSVTFTRLNGAKLSGLGGTLADKPETTLALTGSLSDIANFRGDYEPRFATSKKDDTLDDLVVAAMTMELEAGKPVGLDPPEHKTLKGEIRFAVGKAYLDIITLATQNKLK